MIAVWDPVDEISRIKCDSPWHSSQEQEPLAALVIGPDAPTRICAGYVAGYDMTAILIDDEEVDDNENDT